MMHFGPCLASLKTYQLRHVHLFPRNIQQVDAPDKNGTYCQYTHFSMFFLRLFYKAI
jgi:hypothetical protein